MLRQFVSATLAEGTVPHLLHALDVPYDGRHGARHGTRGRDDQGQRRGLLAAAQGQEPFEHGALQLGRRCGPQRVVEKQVLERCGTRVSTSHDTRVRIRAHRTSWPPCAAGERKLASSSESRTYPVEIDPTLAPPRNAQLTRPSLRYQDALPAPTLPPRPAWCGTAARPRRAPAARRAPAPASTKAQPGPSRHAPAAEKRRASWGPCPPSAQAPRHVRAPKRAENAPSRRRAAAAPATAARGCASARRPALRSREARPARRDSCGPSAPALRVPSHHVAGVLSPLVDGHG